MNSEAWLSGFPSPHADSIEPLIEYSTRTGLSIEKVIGWGIQGVVCRTVSKTALKSYRKSEAYERERNVYLRLREHDVIAVNGHAVPRLLDHDDDLEIISMSIVNPPYVLDFAGAYLDRPGDYEEGTVETWAEGRSAHFGRRWGEVVLVMHAFKKYGVYLTDMKPGNIEFDPAEQLDYDDSEDDEGFG